MFRRKDVSLFKGEVLKSDCFQPFHFVKLCFIFIGMYLLSENHRFTIYYLINGTTLAAWKKDRGLDFSFINGDDISFLFPFASQQPQTIYMLFWLGLQSETGLRWPWYDRDDVLLVDMMTVVQRHPYNFIMLCCQSSFSENSRSEPCLETSEVRLCAVRYCPIVPFEYRPRLWRGGV